MTVVVDEKLSRETFDAVGATRGTIGPPYASALEGCVAGTTTSRCTTSPSRARWSSRKHSACSECGASSTGARNTRVGDAPSFSLGAAVGVGVGVVTGSESVAAHRGSARSPVASRGVSQTGGSEEEAEPAIARAFGLRRFRVTTEDSSGRAARRASDFISFGAALFEKHFFDQFGRSSEDSINFLDVASPSQNDSPSLQAFSSASLRRRSLRSARAVTTFSSKPAMPNPVATFETTEVRPGRTLSNPPDSCTAGSPRRTRASIHHPSDRVDRSSPFFLRVGNISSKRFDRASPSLTD